VKVEDVIIIGAGPAGLATAIQLRRYGFEPLIFERAEVGGLLRNANLVENYPGFMGGIPGPDLAQVFFNQIGECKVTQTTVIELTWEEDLFHAKTLAGIYQARVAVIASGTKPRLLTGFDIPDPLRSHVVYEVADLLGLSGKRMVIVGSGDAAFDYAINMARNNSVIILNRSEQVKCLSRLWEKAQACQNISYHPGTAITELTGCPEGGMTVECSSPRGQMDFHADYLIGAIGREPQLDFVSASVMEKSAALEKMGILHFVGDVKNGIFRQAAIAVGDGIRAGMRIHQVVKENAHESDCLDG
jgi:thioredoxin reductase (NADPH)